ncbi:hypothetical protein V2H33_22265 [Escherichia coli]|uniref:hypothetical protein n=1 Tax=Escherichia coli TaxID=562 RepID=UPI002EC55746|nr:hypothetical protein [Escherichia coli]
MKLQTLEFPYGEITFDRENFINVNELVNQMNRWRLDNGMGTREIRQVMATDAFKVLLASGCIYSRAIQHIFPFPCHRPIHYAETG